MRHYFALVHKDEGSAYGMQFPDVPGVYSAADEAEDIISKAAEALSFYAEDGQLPAPSSHEQIVARKDIQDALAEGAYLVQIPFVENDTLVVRANITIERGLLRAIDTTAKARGLTRSAFLANAARHEIGI